MANNGLTTRDDGAWQLDASAYLPDPQGYITVKGETYPIFSFLDIPVEDSLKVVKLSEEIDKTEDYDQRMQRSIDHILALNRGPDEGRETRKLLSAEILKGLAPRQIITLVVMATTIAAVPLKAGKSNDESQSPSSAPVSADSTVGASEASGA